MRNLVLFPVLMLAAWAPAQTQVRVERPAERTAGSWIPHYVESKRQETAGLRAVGLGPDWAFIHQQVERHLQPQTYPSDNAAGQVALRAAHIQSTANFLVRTGYRARHLTHPAQARTVVRAANIRSWDDADALVLTAPIVFVADFVRIDRKPDNSADLVYRVREPIKSAPAKGSEFRYPLNGPFPTVSAAPGAPPPPPPPPNPPAWELASRKATLFFLQLASAISSPFHLFGPMPVAGERVLPGYHSTTAETTLAAIRTAARAQACSPGYVPVVVASGPPQGC